MKSKSSVIFLPMAFLLYGCVGGSNRNTKYEMGAIYETIVPIVIEPDEGLSFVCAFHDSHLTENQINLRKKYSGDFRRETVKPGLRFRVDNASLVVLDSTWGKHESIDAKLLNGKYGGFRFFLEKISYTEDPQFGIMKWYPDFSIIRRIE